MRVFCGDYSREQNEVIGGNGPDLASATLSRQSKISFMCIHVRESINETGAIVTGSKKSSLPDYCHQLCDCHMQHLNDVVVT